MLSSSQRAHDIALHATDAKISALLNEATRNNRPLSFDYYAMYKTAYNEALNLVEKDFPDSNN